VLDTRCAVRGRRGEGFDPARRDVGRGFYRCGFLLLGAIAFFVSRSLEEPRRPYRLAAAEYSNYRVVEAHVTKLGVTVQERPSFDRSRKVRWQSAPPLAREGWSPQLLVSSKPLFGRARKSPEIQLNDVVYIGLDPFDRLSPLFLGVKSDAR
jgi:hypothetical protein